MASDTVPAAVPGPGDQAGATPNGSTQPAQPGAFSSLFAAVDPARSADTSFNLNPTTTGLDGASDSHTGGGSSAAFHGEDAKGAGTGNGSGNSSSTRQERSVVRAWLLAGAERWKKGGDARLERLRISKAKASALQVKETRTVAVNRTGGGLFGGTSNRSGGGSGASGGGKPGNDKGLGSKSGGGNGSKGPKGPKNKPGAPGNGSAGRSGSGGGAGTGGGGGRGPAGGSGGGPRSPKGGGANTGGTDKTPKTKDPKTPAPKNSPDSKSSPAKDGKSKPAGTGKAGPQGPAGSTGKNTPAPGGGKGNTPKGSDSKSDRKKTPGPDKISLDKTSKTKKTDNPKTPGPKNAPKDADRTAADPRQKPGTTPGAGQGKTLNTQDSRETGYRDGTRAAKTVAHVKAYRDGVHDGYRDTTEAAEREKARLDQAHADRKKQRDEDKPVTGASSADYHPKTQAAPEQDNQQQQATPVQVTNIDASHLQLGDGAARTHISRGEVRTLRNFQNRLTAKTDVMTRVAEATKALKVHADEQAKQVTTLLEQAKAVEGGTSLVAVLTKLEEHAKTQAGKAEEIHKRALRAAEAAKAVVTNSETRYGDIYKAVADSPEARPAKMTYYQETANA
jgi:hypothetical protein